MPATAVASASSSRDVPSPAPPCPVCGRPVAGGPDALQQHVNAHLDRSEHAASLNLARALHSADPASPALPPPTPPSPAKHDARSHSLPPQKQQQQKQQQLQLQLRPPARPASAAADAAPYVSVSAAAAATLRGSLSDSAERFHPDVLHPVHAHYTLSPRARRRRRTAHFCARVDLFCSNLAGWGWDCGFRNIQTLTSALLASPRIAPVLHRASGLRDVPAIPEIAALIERMWRRGVDPASAADFGGALEGKREWIGADEAHVYLRALGLQAQLHDFETPSPVERRDMFDWVYNHFQTRCTAAPCALHARNRRAVARVHSVLPIFCQWHGHSITIVGAEKNPAGQVTLFILDPARGFYSDMLSRNVNRRSLMKRTIHHTQFNHPRFQLVTIVPPKTQQTSHRRKTWAIFNRMRSSPETQT